jgi:hypothetical protein
MKSPKNKYRTEIAFSKPIPGVGSVLSMTSITPSPNIGHIEAMARKNKVKIIVRTYENRAEYPQFKWVLL